MVGSRKRCGRGTRRIGSAENDGVFWEEGRLSAVWPVKLNNYLLYLFSDSSYCTASVSQSLKWKHDFFLPFKRKKWKFGSGQSKQRCNHVTSQEYGVLVTFLLSNACCIKTLFTDEFWRICMLGNWNLSVLLRKMISFNTPIFAFVLPIHCLLKWMWCQKRQTRILAQAV